MSLPRDGLKICSSVTDQNFAICWDKHGGTVHCTIAQSAGNLNNEFLSDLYAKLGPYVLRFSVTLSLHSYCH